MSVFIILDKGDVINKKLFYFIEGIIIFSYRLLGNE